MTAPAPTPDLYKVLGVSHNATEAEVRTAYKKLAVQFHPDRHIGDTSVNYEEKFKEVGEAFEVLSNEEKRRTYDKLGLDGLRKGKVYKPQPPRDVFEAFFGDRNPYAEFQKPSQPPPQSPYPNSQQPSYPYGQGPPNPFANPSPYPQPSHPNPNPSPYPQPSHPNPNPYAGYPPPSHSGHPQPPNPFAAASGSYHPPPTSTPSGYPPGQHVYPPSVGYPPSSTPPGYPPAPISPRSQPSAATALTKNAPVKKPFPCTLEELFAGGVKKFKNVRLVMREGKPQPETRELEVILGKGWKGGSTVTFPGEGDETPNALVADVVVVVEEEPHPLYRRDGNNLVHKAKVNLLEAIVGVELKLKGLDGKEIVVSHPEPITPGMVQVVSNEGFLSHSTAKRGDLIVEFEVLFPKSVTEEQKGALRLSALKDLTY